MSRCFPYPPPGYTGNRGSNEALIESIKLQRERELTKAEMKKEKKREKKERKKEKKEKKEKAKQSISHSSYDDKTNKVDKSRAVSKDVCIQKLIEDENEQLERSDLTEEHQQPAGSQNPSTSSDSTQNSNKRKRHASSAVVEQEERVIRGHGNVIRIRLSSQKNRAVDASVTNVEACSTSGRTESPVQHKLPGAPGPCRENFPAPPRTNFVTGPIPPRNAVELVCSTSRRTETAVEETRPASGILLPEKKLSKGELQYKALIENWTPPPLQTDFEYDEDDQEWLFTKKNPVNQAKEKRQASSSSSISCCGSSTLFPRAQLLPEADIYALPFTVPF